MEKRKRKSKQCMKLIRFLAGAHNEGFYIKELKFIRDLQKDDHIRIIVERMKK